MAELRTTVATTDTSTAASPPAAAADRAFGAGAAGRYDVGAERGRGGLGRVTEAVDRRLGRRVAIKELHRLTADARARFAREVELTARLEHPAIVPVYDAGAWPGGEPYYTMRLVDGRSLSDEIAARAALGDRLALLPQLLGVVDAIAYAHSRGVIHRDLKPSNVVLGAYGEAVVIDWGLAKELGDADGGARAPTDPGGRDAGPTPVDATPPALTEDGAVMGSAPYMAPEQALGAPADQRADVYALGAMLYELIAGAPPYQGRDRHSVLARVLDGPPPPLERHAGAPPELAAIVARAMARAPDDRYASAAELADDLRRFGAGQLVRAHRYTLAGRAWRWMGRHLAIVRIATAALVLVAAIGVVSGLRVRDERDRAARAFARAEATGNALRLEQARTALASDPTAAVAWLRTWTPSDVGRTAAAGIAADAVEAGVARHVLAMPGAAARTMCLASSGRAAVTVDRVGAVRWWDLDAGTSRPLTGGVPRPRACALLDDGRWLAIAGLRGELAVGRVADGAVRVIDGLVARWLVDAPDGRQLVVVTGDGRAVLLDPARAHADGGEAAITATLTPAPAGTAAMAADPVTGAIAIDDRDGVLVWTDPAAPARRLAGVRARAGRMRFSSDGRRLVAADHAGLIAVDLATDAVTTLARPWTGELAQAQWIDDDRAIVFVDTGSLTVRRWTLATGAVEELDTQAFDDVLERSADGRILAWVNRLGEIGVLDVASGRQRRLRGHGGALRRVELSADGATLVSAGDDATLRVWDLAWPGAPRRGHAGDVRRVWVTSRGLVSLGADAVFAWDDAGGERARLPLGPGQVAAVSPDGVVVRGGPDGVAERWTPGDPAPIRIGAAHAAIQTVAIVDAETIAVGLEGGDVAVWPLADAAPRAIARHPRMALGVVPSPDGRWIASAGFDEGVRLHDRRDGGVRTVGDAMVWGLSFDPAGTKMALGTADGAVTVFDLPDAAARRLGAHRSRVTRTAFAPDGRSLISSDDAGGVIRWDLERGTSTRLRGHDAEITAIAIDPAGARVATADLRGHVRIWDLASGAVARVDTEAGAARALAFDGADALVIGGPNGLLVRVPIDADRFAPASAALHGWLAARTHAEIVDDDGVARPRSGAR